MKRKRGDLPVCHPDRKHSGRGLCASCRNKQYRLDNLERLRQKDRVLRRLQRHGITAEKLAGLERRQGGVCAICKKPPSGARSRVKLLLDHDHSDGHIRGLLCGNCNTGLGMFLDSLEFLRKAVQYLYADRRKMRGFVG